MFEKLDKYLREFLGHEQQRYEELSTMTKEQQRHIYETDENFMWHNLEQIGTKDDDTVEILPKQKLMITKNKRFVHCMKHKHTYIELQYVYSGTLTNLIEGQKIEVKTGEVLLMDTSVEHELLPAGINDIGINIIMHKEYFDSKFRDMLVRNDYIARFVVDSLYASKEQKKYILFSCGEDERIQLVMKLLLDEWRKKESGYDTALQGYMLSIFTNLMRNYGEKNTVSGSDMKEMFMEELSEYLQEHYKTADLKSTAAHFNFNQDYLSRLIKKQVGVSFVAYLQEIKMEQACIMLVNTKLSMDEIADQLGYRDVSHFYKVFRKTYDTTPGDFRKNAQ